MPKYGLHNQLVAKEGDFETLKLLLLKASQIVSTLPGCQIYLVSKDPNDELGLLITEVWDSKEAHEASLANEEVKVLITKAMPFLGTSPNRNTPFEVYGGHGLS